LKPLLDSAKRLAAGDDCMAFGIDAGMLPHHENWPEFPVMVSVFLSGSRRCVR
jgi:tryptophan 2-monooxygenase